jgi:hypothetical protein
MTCVICRRVSRGFGFSPADIRIDAPNTAQCSLRCQNITLRLKGMIDPNKHETRAFQVAATNAGAYVDEIGKTDLMQWTEYEWVTLIEVAVTAFQDALRQAYADDAPF